MIKPILSSKIFRGVSPVGRRVVERNLEKIVHVGKWKNRRFFHFSMWAILVSSSPCGKVGKSQIFPFFHVVNCVHFKKWWWAVLNVLQLAFSPLAKV